MHGHWLLVRLARTFSEAPFTAEARAALQLSLTRENIAQEVAYLGGPGRASFERPYGLAWPLQLGAELREWDEMSARLRPLEDGAVTRLTNWLPKLSHPGADRRTRSEGFVLRLMIDYARRAGDKRFARLGEDSAKTSSSQIKTARSPTNHRAKTSFHPAWAKQK